MRTALAALALVVTAGGAQAIEPTAKQLIKAYTEADEACRGLPGGSGAAECDRRARLTSRLNQIGRCYGKANQDRSEFAWHACTFHSNRSNDLVPASR
ncbi:hypothetical protein MKK75_14630 [Methylobacterium sp. J-030]|uniref:hypothetical protein n=1 Tax=Methylobacterium sp. J-030 TaxID=2836627 RepID=UPI001FBB5EC1|nr:hypothetical protein [Methylobacterium sp. J-030]MCJ2070016.1 hypothetical protein [Methylobacterium sp. J-030]